MLVFAQDEAMLLNHDHIDTEHFLLALIHERTGVAATALEAFGVSSASVRELIEESVGIGRSRPSGWLPFTLGAKDVMFYALSEAIQLGHNYIGTGHLLLALIGEGKEFGTQVLRKEFGAQVLIQLGVDLERLRLQVTDLLSQHRHRDREPVLAPSVERKIEAIASEAREAGFITVGTFFERFPLLNHGPVELGLIFRRLEELGVDVVDPPWKE